MKVTQRYFFFFPGLASVFDFRTAFFFLVTVAIFAGEDFVVFAGFPVLDDFFCFVAVIDAFPLRKVDWTVLTAFLMG